MMSDEPIGYELTDDGADPDSDRYPVDSTVHRCCRGIGRHTADCTGVDDAVPAPRLPDHADPTAVTEFEPEGYRLVSSRPFLRTSGDDEIQAVCCQAYDGRILTSTGCEPVVYFHGREYSPEQARELAAALTLAAHLADNWAATAAPVATVVGRRCAP